MVMVNPFVPPLVFMLAFIPALPWCLVATTHRSVIRAEGRFYGFCSTSRYIRTKLHPVQFLSEYLSIEGLESVLFVMTQPPWQSKEGDPRFWRARGVVQR